mgnify:CR=1 FL=1
MNKCGYFSETSWIPTPLPWCGGLHAKLSVTRAAEGYRESTTAWGPFRSVLRLVTIAWDETKLEHRSNGTKLVTWIS